jgi:hypothetical protein
MSFTLPPGKSVRFNPPPNWPAPQPGWTPPPGWVPDPSWPPPPEGWLLWTEHSATADAASGAGMGPGARKSGRPPRWVILVGAVVIGLIIANLTPGVLGHVLALIVWGLAAWACLRPARSGAKSAARTWARIGVAASVVLAVYAGALAVVSGISSSLDNYCLLSVSNNDDGTQGVLAVPQTGATQSLCNSAADNTQEDANEDVGEVGDIVNALDNEGGSFAIYADKPGYLNPYQQNNMQVFGLGGEFDGVVYSGTVLGLHGGIVKG